MRRGLTDKELEDFTIKSRKKYKVINFYIKNKCKNCEHKNCAMCNFDFSKFLMRSILVDDNCICRKCEMWLTDLCYNQGTNTEHCPKKKETNKETHDENS
jgi:hypothetical protein